MRIEDLDPLVSRRELGLQQLEDLAAIGLDWDGPVVFQSERTGAHHQALAQLRAANLTYPCYCTRREVREAASAPNGPPLPEGAYPGTCLHRSSAELARLAAAGRPPAVRLRTNGAVVSFVDVIAGPTHATVDDLVLVRNDGVVAYNLAVVVDDGVQRIGQVVRGDDLLLSTPRQLWLAQQLGLPSPSFAHVPLVLGPDGERLAKRHGSVTLGDLNAQGWSPSDVLGLLAASLGLAEQAERATPSTLLARFDPSALPTMPWILDPTTLTL